MGKGSEIKDQDRDPVHDAAGRPVLDLEEGSHQKQRYGDNAKYVFCFFHPAKYSFSTEHSTCGCGGASLVFMFKYLYIYMNEYIIERFGINHDFCKVHLYLSAGQHV